MRTLVTTKKSDMRLYELVILGIIHEETTKWDIVCLEMRKTHASENLILKKYYKI